jgi:cardiolipin synthase
MLTKLDQAAIEWHPMLPLRPLKGEWRRPDLRNHRKIVVVDGRSAFCGSQNMIDASYHNKKHEAAGRKWRELVARVEGPVVQSFDLVFATDWFIETKERLAPEVRAVEFPPGNGDMTCQVVPSGPGFPNENNLKLFNLLIYGAQRRLSITSPYFVPDESMMRGLLAATRRGVHVELFVSEIGDQGMVWHAQRSYYGALLSAGVEIYCYPAPYILHAKHISVDDETAMIGSSNMDMRSFALNSEISVLMRSREFVAQMREVEAEYRRVGTPLTREAWAAEPTFRTTVDGLARLTSSLQ